MKKRTLFLTVCLHAGILFSQAPVVSNVTFVQRTDGSLIVDIYYDLSDTDGETKTIDIEASDDNGTTWDVTCACMTGDIGGGVSCGTGKHVEWDFYADNPDVSGSSYKVRVTASEVGTMTGNDGRTYQTIKIGDQWWTAENSKETQYRNGNAIPNEVDREKWASLVSGARCAYDNNESNADTYGYLYNWFAVVDSRNLAPAGWHVPSDAEWKQLEIYLGMSSSEAGKSGFRGTDEGGKMKEVGTVHWNSPNAGATNESGFTALPGGKRVDWGDYYQLGLRACFWSVTEDNYAFAWDRSVHYNSSEVCRFSDYKESGYSVRLVKD